MEPPSPRGRAFQLTTKEARAAPDVTNGMFLFIILLIIFHVILIYVPLIGIFLLNFFPALVLFNSGESQSFVSRSFSREIDMPIGS